MSIMVENIEFFIDMFKNETDIEPWEDVEIVPEDDEETKSQDHKTPKGKAILIHFALFICSVWLLMLWL